MRSIVVLVGVVGAAALAHADAAVDVFGNGRSTCALRGDGGVSCWGQTNFGATETALTSVPVPITGLPAGIEEVAGDDTGTCARTASGTAHCWGWRFGSTTPVVPPGLGSGIAAIDAGGTVFCALTATGSVMCGEFDPPDFVGGLETGATAISSHLNGCALTPAGGVRCWGLNDSGQLGNGEIGGVYEDAVQVSGITSGAIGVAVGQFHSCALLSGGEVRCWGSNGYGQLGNGSFDESMVPIPGPVTGLPADVVKVVAGELFSCALTGTGAVWCWGQDWSGQLGQGELLGSSATPLPVQGLPAGIVTIAAGISHACALTSSGAIHCWGSNNLGELGIGSRIRSTQPVSVTGLPPGVVSMSQACAITAAGQAWCLGGGSSVPQLLDPFYGIPDPVSAFTIGAWLTTSGVVKRWDLEFGPPATEAILAGATALAGGISHSCALQTPGSVWCWGPAGYIGVLGPSADYPVQVTSLGTSVTAIAAGDTHTCARTSAGAALCWGSGFDGALGNGSTSHQNTPTPVSGLASGVAALSTSRKHTCALTAGGGVQCWGLNDSGQLGDGTTTKRLSPVQVSGLESGAVAISTGPTHSCALMQDGSMRCWGRNGSGQLGDATFQNRLTPAVVSGISGGVSRIFALADNTCALMTNGTLQCWGDNSAGQLGDGSPLRSAVPQQVTGFEGAAQVPLVGVPGAFALAALLTGVGAARLRRRAA